MLQNLFTKAPLIAILGAIIVFLIVAGAGMGLEWPLLVAVATTIFAIAEGWVLWLTIKQKAQGDRHIRHIRFIADRFQSMVRCAPCGYCLFTPQGLLREEMGVASRLGIEKLSHMDDLIGAVKDGPELLEAFRKLQVTGDPFDMDIHANKDGRVLPLAGRRFRIGREGPHVDVLWFCDQVGAAAPAQAVPQKTQASGPAHASKTSRQQPNKMATHAALKGKSLKEITVPVAQTAAPKADAAAACVSVPSSPLSFDLFAFPVWGRGADLKIVFCNSAYAQAMDKQAAEVLSGQHELVSHPTKGGGQAMASRALATKETQTDRQHVIIGGQRKYMEITEVPVPQAAQDAGLPFALLGFAVDITAEEEKDTELKRHLAAHHEVMEHLGTAISVYGPDMRLEFYNRSYQRLWDAEESFLDDKPTFSEILEDLRTRRRIPEQADFQKYKKERMALFTSLLEPREDVMFLPDGTSLRILAAPHPLGGLMFVHENVTDQLNLETSYNTLMAVQHETIDNLAEGIAVFGPDGKLRLFNAALAKLWELPQDFLQSQPHVAELLETAKPLLDTTDDWAAYKTAMVGYSLDRNPHSGRLDRTDKLIIEYLTVPLPDGSVLNSFLDVTDTVRVEQALRASNAALATADRLKSDFVANVSYQLRTPLNTITGFAEILAEQYFGKLNERQLEYTTTIKSESDKLARLINDVLDLATIEAGRMALDREQVDVAEVINDAKMMTSEWARQQSLEILVDCPSDIGTFDVDENRIKQVLFNLISNAIKYTPAGGHIALAAWRQDPWVVISVLDTGVGIPEEDQERVFGKFEKANNHLRQAGAGLGLSLVKSFVELHGGRVEIFSDEKDGTRISCFLPQKAPAKTETIAKGA